MTLALVKVYTGSSGMSADTDTIPPPQQVIPRNTDAKSCSTRSASAGLVSGRNTVKRGSNPPLPSGTSSSQ
ncbi:hypothetical protein D3C76_1623470 [compost metagenome]